MNKLFTNLNFAVVTTTTISSVLILSTGTQVQASTFNYSFQTDTGFSGEGLFSFDGNPTTVSESGAGSTNFLQSLSLSVFDPDNNFLDSGDSVINGVSSNPFFLFEFDALTETLNIIDNNTAASGNDPYWVLTNTAILEPGSINNMGQIVPVAPGSVDYNLFEFSPNTNIATFLGSTTSIQVSSVPDSTTVPEPTTIWGILTVLGVISVLKKSNA